MDKKDKEKIAQQLAAQADRIRNEDDEIQVAADTVNTCQALLRILDKNMPQGVSESDFEDILSGYVGLTARIKFFYQNNSDYVSEGNSKLLGDLLSEITAYQRRKSDLDAEYENKMDELSILKKDYEIKEAEVHDLNDELSKTENTVAALNKEFNDLNSRAEDLKEEEHRLKDDIENFEPMLEDLTESIQQLKKQYAEMTAYFPEFDRIRLGLENDGYVDVRDFTEKVKSQIETGNEVIRWCDDVLSKVSKDVETLQETIEKRRKAGA